MAFKWDKEKTILSAVGSIVLLVLGYLIWRHERTVTQADSAAALAAQQNIAQQQTDQIQSELDALPQFSSGGGGGLADEELNSGADDGGASNSPVESEIAAILAAFYPPTPAPTQPVSTTPTAPATPATPGPSTPDQPVNDGGGVSTGILPITTGVTDPIITAPVGSGANPLPPTDTITEPGKVLEPVGA